MNVVVDAVEGLDPQELWPFEYVDYDAEPDPILGDPAGGLCDADEAAESAATARFGSGVITPLGPLDTETLSHRGRVDLLVALERVRGWVDAQQARLLAVLAADPRPASTPIEKIEQAVVKDFVREEVACALRLAPVTAQHRLDLARTLAGRLPHTLAALGEGRLTFLQARTLAEAVAPLADAVATKVERRVLDRALDPGPSGGGAGPAGLSLTDFRRTVQRAVLCFDPRSADEHHMQSLAARRVAIRPEPHGMASLWALVPAADAAAIDTRLDVAARLRLRGDERSVDQRRADALIAALVAPATDNRETNQSATGQISTEQQSPSWSERAEPGCPVSGRAGSAGSGRRPLVQVTVALSTLLGLDQQPGELAGHGSIPPELTRAIAHDPTGTWQRLITDDTGHLLHLDRTRHTPPATAVPTTARGPAPESGYRPSRALREYVVARDRTCRFPNCNRTACTCELDHLDPHADGGETSACNLHPLCCRHHHIKHDAGWTVTRDPDGTSVWTSPTGHRYQKPPATYPIDRTTDPPGDVPPY